MNTPPVIIGPTCGTAAVGSAGADGAPILGARSRWGPRGAPVGLAEGSATAVHPRQRSGNSDG